MEIQDLFRKQTMISPLKDEPIRKMSVKSEKQSKERSSSRGHKRKRKEKDQDKKRHKPDRSQTPKQTETHLNDLVPLSSVGELVEKSIYNAVDAVSSAIIVAANNQPLPPAQDLRPVTNQLMATNTNLAQVAGILSVTNTKHGDLSLAINDLVKTTSSMASQLSRMTRVVTVVTVLTEVASKMDQHLIEQTNTVRSVVQGAIDSHSTLTEAMKAHPQVYNYGPRDKN